MSASEDEVPQLRPDVGYTIKRTMSLGEDYDLEEEDDGFHCRDCDWRGVSVKVDLDDDDLKSVCPNCGGTDVENKLSTHIEEIERIYSTVDTEDGFVPYSYFKKLFEPPKARLDDALNHLITRQDGYVVFEDGEPQIYVGEI